MTEESNPKESTAAHSDVTLNLAKKESAEHMHGMKELIQEMQKRPLSIKAYHTNHIPPGGKIKTVHFVRHGQGFHNLMADLFISQGREWVQFSKSPSNPYAMPQVLDSPLTHNGRSQAALLRPIVETIPSPQMVVVSPLCRTLQTALIAFRDLPVPFLAHEMVREESGVHLCDKRRPTSDQVQEFPRVDFTLLESEEDLLFRDDARESKMELGERIYLFMEWLESREEEVLAVVSHSGWLLAAFNGVFQCEDDLKGWFQTGELRSVKLAFHR